MPPLLRPKILVLGDFMLDVYTRGRVERLSPEAPVPVLCSEGEEARLGGAGAVAALLASLGCHPLPAGVVGNDSAGEFINRLLRTVQEDAVAASRGGLADKETRGRGDKEKLLASERSFSPCLVVPLSPCRAESCRRGGGQDPPTPPLLVAHARPTTVKQRFIGQSCGRQGQQLLRVDREVCRPLAGEIEEGLLSAALAALEEAAAVLISDYGKGVCTPTIVGRVIAAARRRRLSVLVDPRRGADYRLYRWVNVIKPNRHEAGEATGRSIRARAQAFAAGKELCTRWGFQAAVITLDADGLALVTADGERHFAARPREVADVTGAGDTVLAVLGAALARGLELADACQLAVTAAGLQVERSGVSPVSWSEIASVGNALCGVPPAAERNDKETRGQGDKELSLNSPCPPAPCPLVPLSPCQPISVEDLKDHLALHRVNGHRITFTNGCFDLFHAGHLHCLMAAKALGDVLVVAINSDAGVRRLKGAPRPIVGQ
ncbi:MAG TPA: PfkB family carbohydrate kinase, partial [Pirellulales bacterium]|nr:PfkB family carbohydrate kinase [Pirellulales bacterium]